MPKVIRWKVDIVNSDNPNSQTMTVEYATFVPHEGDRLAVCAGLTQFIIPVVLFKSIKTSYGLSMYYIKRLSSADYGAFVDEMSSSGAAMMYLPDFNTKAFDPNTLVQKSNESKCRSIW